LRVVICKKKVRDLGSLILSEPGDEIAVWCRLFCRYPLIGGQTGAVWWAKRGCLVGKLGLIASRLGAGESVIRGLLRAENGLFTPSAGGIHRVEKYNSLSDRTVRKFPFLPFFRAKGQSVDYEGVLERFVVNIYDGGNCTFLRRGCTLAVPGEGISRAQVFVVNKCGKTSFSQPIGVTLQVK
jgi:hypothetical protein